MAKRQTKTLTIPNAGKDAGQLELGRQNGLATLENSLAVSYEIKHTLLCLINPTPIYPRKMKPYVYPKVCA